MTHLLDESRSKASTSMRRKHIDFHEMCSFGVDDFDVRKANGSVSRQCNPEVSLVHGLLKDGVACRLSQNRFRRVTTQKPRGGHLDLRNLTDVFCPRPNDRVVADARETMESGRHGRRQLRMRRDTFCFPSRSIQSDGDGRLADHARGHH